MEGMVGQIYVQRIRSAWTSDKKILRLSEKVMGRQRRSRVKSAAYCCSVFVWGLKLCIQSLYKESEEWIGMIMNLFFN